MAKNISVQNSFVRGLVTEATGLNFPENACTATQNCVFTLIGDVTRRLGINFEDNFANVVVGLNSKSVSTFRWTNAGGDGETELLVFQAGNTLFFFKSSSSTTTSPLSSQLTTAQVNLTAFQAFGNTNNISLNECQYATGNGYLFVFHPDCDPFYCTYVAPQTVQANRISVQIRDTLGYYPEPGNPAINFRPNTLTAEHQYNLQNQGWTGVPKWTGVSTTNPLIVDAATPNNHIILNTGNNTFTIASGLSGSLFTVGQTVSLSWSGIAKVENTITQSTGFVATGGSATGTLTSYTTGSGALVVDITSNTLVPIGPSFEWLASGGAPIFSPGTGPTWTITPGATNNTINTFFTDEGVYPSNSDIWYTFKDDTGVFNPTGTYGSVGITTTPGPKGFYIYNAFQQSKSEESGIAGLTDLSTEARPSTGAWFQGRVWYAGTNGAQPALGDQNFYTWSENIYFSQIINPGDTTSFGNCYQQNDPTDETFFDILPTDGGVITIQGSGNISKLFVIQNGMLVFADNGVWFITGSQGIGFSATDYTITKISSIRTLSPFSFIDVNGLPYFWNEEGIYSVIPAKQQGLGLTVEPLTIGTILSFYNEIPLDSKIYARGDYDPINYVVKWVFRSTQEANITNRYAFDSVLNFNIVNKAFYPYSISLVPGGVTPQVSGLFYMSYPNSVTAPLPSFKYIAYGNQFTFAEENDVSYLDWGSQDFTSFFTTGYSMHGRNLLKWQPTYVYMFSRNDDPWAYTIQGVWDFSINPSSGRQSSTQTVINGLGQPNFGMSYRRHKIRGHGIALQLTLSSVQGQPFDIMGWSIYESIDAGV